MTHSSCFTPVKNPNFVAEEKQFTSNNNKGGAYSMPKKNEQLPDFKELDDRLIAEASSSPSLVIKTNLDKDDVKEDNPYATGQSNSDTFENFFKE